jgi:hypothetical protein
MACPSCGNTFHSDFKLSAAKRDVRSGIFIKIFEFPGKILSRVGQFIFSR